MTELHMHKDGDDHIWQVQSKQPYQGVLVKIEYLCVCGATMIQVRDAEVGEVFLGPAP